MGRALFRANDEYLRALNDSIHFDRRMYREDIAGSQAWARAWWAPASSTKGRRTG